MEGAAAHDTKRVVGAIVHVWCRIMADLAVGMLQGVAAEMAERPLNEEDEAIANEELLAPMLGNNDVRRCSVIVQWSLCHGNLGARRRPQPYPIPSDALMLLTAAVMLLLWHAPRFGCDSPP